MITFAYNVKAPDCFGHTKRFFISNAFLKAQPSKLKPVVLLNLWFNNYTTNKGLCVYAKGYSLIQNYFSK